MEMVSFMVFWGFGCFMLSFLSKRNHLLATLLSLEGVMFMMFLGFYCYGAWKFGLWGFMLGFLTLMVCEGALGLSLLVRMVRGFGGDKVSSLNLLEG